MLPNIGPMEMIIGLVIILLLFGAKKIPELARGLGSGVREFKAGTKEGPIEDKEDKKDEELKAADTETASPTTAETSETAAKDDDVTVVEPDKAEQQSR